MSGQHHTITVTYNVVRNGNAFSAIINGVGIKADIGPITSGVDTDGNITMAKHDSADIIFELYNDDWLITKVEIKGHDHDNFGNALDSDQQADYPDFSASDGSMTCNAGSVSISDTNSKSSEIDYRLTFSDGTNTVLSDPKVRDNGDAN